ncbi:zinc ribbon domain-containing protein [Nocardia sp. NRRL S-836]|uniref:zinc ribbon domain-containing protein n=1 Tax=Nocardia sp. NRRL S-836 TaxID=1519492 RepID=UPI0018D1C3C2|nr:zinc ribbon domain-containing protein [Nocardia sp. NRRL S-836]
MEINDFTAAQLLRKSKGSLRTARKTERSERAVKHRYLFRGRIRCDICGRKMEGSPRKKAMYYRCPARTLAPGSPVLASHPGAVYLREDLLQDAINGWLGHLFDRKNRERTVAALMDSQEPVIEVSRDAAKRRLADAEAKLTRFQNAIMAGVDPAALVEAINDAQAERLAARAALDNIPAPVERDIAEIYAAIDSIGDVGAALRGHTPTGLEELYDAIDLQVRYKQNPHEVDFSINPVGVNSAGVRGGT